MDEIQKRRVTIFSAGVVIGTLVSIVLFQLWQDIDEPMLEERVDIVVAACSLEAGQALEASCARVREGVPSRYVPPQTLLAKDLDWHLGKEISVDIAEGNAIRIVDFTDARR